MCQQAGKESNRQLSERNAGNSGVVKVYRTDGFAVSSVIMDEALVEPAAEFR